MSETLLDRINTEAELCRNEHADDIADLLQETVAHLTALCALLHLPPDTSADDVTARVKGLVEALEVAETLSDYVTRHPQLVTVSVSGMAWKLQHTLDALAATGK